MKSNIHHYLIVATGIALALGPMALSFSCAGIFIAPVSETLGVGKGVFASYLTVALFTMFIVMPVAGKLVASKDIRVVLSVCVLLVGGSLIAFSFFSAVWQFYIGAVFIGMGMVPIAYLAIPTLLNRWFKVRVGFLLGLVMAFTGVGGVLFNPLGGYLIANYGWQTGYRVFGVLAIAIALPFTLFAIRSFPTDKGLLPHGETGDSTSAGADRMVLTGVSASAAYRSPVFYAMVAFAGLAGFMVNGYHFLPAFASSLPLSQTVTGLAAALASFIMLGQTLGKVGLGIAADKSTLGGVLIALAAGVIGLLMFWLAPTSTTLFFGAGLLFGLFYTTPNVLVPIMSRAIFGVRDYAQIYSRIAMASTLMSAISVAVWGFLIDHLGGYTVLFVGGVAVLAASALAGSYALLGAKRLAHTAE